jgi:hypothetical protein
LFTRPAVAAALAGLVLIGAAPAAAALRPDKAAKPTEACDLLGAKAAAKFFGSAAQVTEETNRKHYLHQALNRTCDWTSGNQVLAYSASIYHRAADAKAVYQGIRTASKTPRAGSLLMGAGDFRIKGQPAYVFYVQLIPGLDDPPPTYDFQSNVIVRKGATLLIEEYLSDDDATPGLRKAAKTIVPAM